MTNKKLNGLKIWLLLSALSSSNLSLSQISNQWNTTIHYEVKGFHNELTGKNVDRSVYVDDFIHNKRTFVNSNYTEDKEYSDNPFRHFATYTGIFLKSSFKSNYHFIIGAYFEQRSASGGINKTDNILVFPRISFHLKDTITWKSSLVKFDAFVGSHFNSDFEDFLRLYNLDFQAINLKIGIKKLWLNFSQIADLNNNVGLGLTEHARIGLIYMDDKKKIAFNYEGNWIRLSPGFEGNIKSYFAFKLDNVYEFKGQLNVRFNKSLLSNKPIAFGITNSLSWTSFKLDVNARYYGESFNFGYYHPWSIDYRGVNNGYVGKQFYALKNFYRDFNQWAVFTEYEDNKIANIEIKGQYSKKLRKNLSTHFILDYNLIRDFTNNNTIHYPILSIDFSIDLVQDFSLIIRLSNKQMNLDIHYETFYVSKKLFLGFLIEKRINGLVDD